MFNEGRTNVHDEERSGRPSLITGLEKQDPSYSPDVAPSDFHLFTHLKQFMGGTCMGSEEEVKKTVKDWLNGLAADY
jgi:hypothetical protein